jgi:cold shock CspA family protein
VAVKERESTMKNFVPTWVIVKFFDHFKRYGFFKQANEGADIHVHEIQLTEWGFDPTKCADGVPALVSFESNTETGRLRATMVHRIGMWDRPEFVDVIETVTPAPKKPKRLTKPKLSETERLIVKRSSLKKVPDTGMAAAFRDAAQRVQARMH